MPKDEKLPRAVAFKVLKEDWNQYRLEDGTLMRVRTVLMSIAQVSGRKHPRIPPEYSATYSNLIVVNAPEDLRGPPNPSPLSVDELYKKKLSEVEIERRKEVWNYYLIRADQVIKTRLSANIVLRADGEYDRDGNVMYILNSSNIMSIIRKKEAASELRRLGYEIRSLK